MRLFLLSDTSDITEELKKKLYDQISKYNNNIAYISSSFQEEPYTWFQNTWNEYKSINTDIQMKYFDLSDKFTDAKLKEALNFKIIHLSGGNTYFFLKNLRKRNFIQELINYTKDDNLLIGVSAGAIIMTPTISISETANDTNDSDLESFEGLGLVPFEFYPHFDNSEMSIQKLKEYSIATKNKICIADNSSGIYVENGKTRLISNVEIMYQGEFMKTSSTFLN